jgi:putative transposase
VELEVARKRVCVVLDAPRSTIYAREAAVVRNDSGVVIAFPKRGPRTQLSDDELLVLIREVINESPFAGEGHRKVTARLRREHRVSVGRKRVLRLMRLAGLLAPQRARKRSYNFTSDDDTTRTDAGWGSVLPPATACLGRRALVTHSHAWGYRASIPRLAIRSPTPFYSSA